LPAIPTLVAVGLALPLAWIGGLQWAPLVLALVVLLVPAILLLGPYPVQGASAAITTATFTVVYFVLTGGAMGLLRTAFPGTLGVKIVITHCMAIWAGDTGAYYVGVSYGKHRLAPQASPKKSWEGVIGGTLLTFFGIWFCREAFFPELGWRTGFWLGVLLSIAAPIGDLVESLFKRDAAVKDSSDRIPGHGGFLDRIDSLFYAAPFVLALFLLLGISP
jgi:phosphatidate cytidylyltransferase